VLGCTACGGRNSIPAAQNVLAVLMARANMTPEEGAKAMVPYIYDASTPHERIEEDLALRRRDYPQPAGYKGQLEAILAWSSFDRLSMIRAPTLIVHGETDQLVPPKTRPFSQTPSPVRAWSCSRTRAIFSLPTSRSPRIAKSWHF
jgi:pimeloyl-ACP methyl ester carboxylesterase